MTHEHDDSKDGDGPRHFYGVVPVFLVDDVVRTAEYYRDVLGFDVDFVYGEPPIYARVSRGDAVIDFNLSNPPGRRNGVSATAAGNGIDALLVVSDLDDLFEELKQRGATVVHEPVSQSYGMRELHIEDCNRYRLVLTEELDEPEGATDERV